MSEKLRQVFKNKSDCYADSDDVVQAMTEDIFVEVCQAHNKELKAELLKKTKALNYAIKRIRDAGQLAYLERLLR